MEHKELLQKLRQALEALMAAGVAQLEEPLAAMTQALEGLEKAQLLLSMDAELREFAQQEQKKHLNTLNDQAKAVVMQAYSLPKAVFEQVVQLRELIRLWPVSEPVKPAPAKVTFCRFCGGVIPQDHRFCPHCGSMGGAPARPNVPVEPEKPASTNFCPACGSTVSGSTRFCRCCGGAIPQGEATILTPQDKVLFCNNCGSAMDSDSRFCPKCGCANDRRQPRLPAAPPPMAPSMAPPMPSKASPPPMPNMAPSMAPMPSAAASSSGGKVAPAKRGGLFSGLFGGKNKEKPAPVTADDVQFRGAAPASIRAGEYFTVKIMMYREDDYARADRESASLAEKIKSASSSVFRAERDQVFRIVLQSPQIDIEDNSAQLRWNGKFASADFDVLLPEDFDKKQLRIRGRVYSGDAVLTDLKLILQVQAERPQEVVCEKTALRSAFISYASADRAAVVARIQGIQLACPDMDLFFDVESLRRGESWEPRLFQEIEKRDLFYLFWSVNAARSEWVAKELGYAVAKKTIDYIEPIPLQSPDVCPPPQVLTGKHFNDWTLRYLNK